MVGISRAPHATTIDPGDRLHHPGAACILAALLLGLLVLPGPAPAQVRDGVVEGHAWSPESEQPLAFSLVRLLPVEPDAVPAMGTITDAEGRFHFEDVPSGAYQVQLELIGYQRTLSPVLHVQPGDTVRQDIRGEMESIQLAGITVHAEGTCLDGARLSEDRALTGLWEEARKGVETRHAFDRRYRYTRYVQQQVRLRRRLFGTSRHTEVDTLVNDPDSVVARDRRKQEEHRAEGYVDEGATGFVIRMPNEKELLDEEFLTTHCLEAAVDTAGGSIRMRFRPAKPRRDITDIRGTIWLEPETYLIERLEFDYVKGREPIAESSVEYADVSVGGSRVRLPVAGEASGRPTGLMGVAIPAVDVSFTMDYRDFQRVRSE